MKPFRAFVDLDGFDPLDPLKAALAGSDEAKREPMTVRQGFVADMGCQKIAFRFL